MKKTALFLSALILALTGCGKSEKPRVYTFSGTNDDLMITDGEITISDKSEKMYSGNLVIQSDIPENTAYYTMEYYVIVNGEKEVIMKNKSDDFTRIEPDKCYENVSIEGDILSDGAKENIESLCFVLKTVDADGNTSEYTLKPEVTEKQ